VPHTMPEIPILKLFESGEIPPGGWEKTQAIWRGRNTRAAGGDGLRRGAERVDGLWRKPCGLRRRKNAALCPSHRSKFTEAWLRKGVIPFVYTDLGKCLYEAVKMKNQNRPAAKVNF